MSEPVVIDTGPLVSYLVRGAEQHEWAVDQWKRLSPPLYTCEAVLAEAEHLLRRENQPTTALLELIEHRALVVSFSIADEISNLKNLLRRYRDVPMSLADACLVRMSEIRERSLILTMNSHFLIYRRFGRQVVPVSMPPRD